MQIIETERMILRPLREEDETWAIELKENHQVVGSIGLHKSKKANIKYDRELSCVLPEEYWEQGLMPEAAKRVIEYAFQVLKIDILLTSHIPFNTQSKRVIEKLGFEYMTHLTGNGKRYDGVELDEEVYVLYSKEYRKKNPVNPAVELFKDWQETMLWSCFQGHMGKLTVNCSENPTAAQVAIGDFCFFAGMPDVEFAKTAAAPIIIPRDDTWNDAFEKAFGESVTRDSHYSIKKEPHAFDRKYLEKLAAALPDGFTAESINKDLYDLIIEEDWSRDLCSQFESGEDYEKRGIGVAVLYNGKPVSGASSYTIYNEGIEIEIDTMPEFRRKGLATACGARLILDCLDCGLYPSWDAHDLRSVALSEKLGYHMDQEYSVYYKNN